MESILVEKKVDNFTTAQLLKKPQHGIDNRIIGTIFVLQVVRNGETSTYGRYDTISEAQKFFQFKFGKIEVKHLRNEMYVAYMKKKEGKNTSKSATTTHSMVIDTTKVVYTEPKTKTTKTVKSASKKSGASPKQKKVGVLDNCYQQCAELMAATFSREDACAYLLSEGYNQHTVTRTVNRVYGKVEKPKKHSATIQPASKAPTPVSIPTQAVYMTKEWYIQQFGVAYDPLNDNRFVPGVFKKKSCFATQRMSYGHSYKQLARA